MGTKKARRQPGGDTDNYGGRAFAVKSILPQLGGESQLSRKTTFVRDLSALLDQALNLKEYHESEAAFYRHQAEIHERNAKHHRRILRQLQYLIPRPTIQTEVADDGQQS